MPIQMNCKTCGQPFTCYESDKKRGRLYCSLACRSADRFDKAVPLAARNTPINFTCRQCGKGFMMMKAYLDQYRKKYGRDPLYCSRACTGLARRIKTEANQTFSCEECGKVVPRRRYERAVGYTKYYAQQRFCSPECKAANQRTTFHRRFADGTLTRRIRKGYVMIRVPTGPGEPRKEVFEHRYVMEQFLGRPLRPEETVHHRRAWDKTTNTLENLELRTGNHGPGGAVEDLIPWCIEMLTLYPEFVSPEQHQRLIGLSDIGRFQQAAHLTGSAAGSAGCAPTARSD